MSCWMTNEATQTDGFGSQYQTYFAAIAIAAHFRMNFVFTNPRRLAHNYLDENDWGRKLNEFSGISASFYNFEVLPARIGITKEFGVEMTSLLDMHLRPECHSNIQTLYIIKDSKKILDKFPAFWSVSKNILHMTYFSTRKPILSFFSTRHRNAVVFQRRKNTNDHRKILLPNDYYISVMRQIASQVPDTHTFR